MKLAIALFTLALSFSSFAEAEELDDLQTIDIQLEGNESPMYNVQYPGYRIGGGIPPRMEITDCLLLDIKDSDRLLTTRVKMNLAKRLVILDGFQFEGRTPHTLNAEVKGNNIVFKIKSGGGYVTQFQVKSKDGKSLKSNINASLPRSADANAATPVGLVYIRACRF